MYKLGIILPYAVSIRDLVSTGTLKLLCANRNIKIVIYTLNPAIPEFDSLREQGAIIRGFSSSSNSKIENIFKGLYRLFFINDLYIVRSEVSHPLLLKIISRLIYLVKNVIGTLQVINLTFFLLQRLYKIRSPKKQLDSDLDLLIGTRSLLYSIDYDLMMEASIRKIPMVLIASSWDNFTTKGFFPFNVSKIMVWNQKMKDELTSIFAIDSNQIEIVGYPRLEILKKVDNNDLSPEQYLMQIGLSTFKNFILFSASYSVLTKVPEYEVPLEYMNIISISKKLSSILPDNVAIIIRLHPFSSESDKDFFKNLKNSFVFVPGRQDDYVERVMDFNDESHLTNQISKSLCVISMASTISIDALCLSKPIINICFDPIDDISESYSIKRFYQFDHFSSLVELVKLPLARNESEILEYVSSIMKDNHISVDYNIFRSMYVPLLNPPYPDRVYTAITQTLNNIYETRN